MSTPHRHQVYLRTLRRLPATTRRAVLGIPLEREHVCIRAYVKRVHTGVREHALGWRLMAVNRSGAAAVSADSLRQAGLLRPSPVTTRESKVESKRATSNHTSSTNSSTTVLSTCLCLCHLSLRSCRVAYLCLRTSACAYQLPASSACLLRVSLLSARVFGRGRVSSDTRGRILGRAGRGTDRHAHDWAALAPRGALPLLCTCAQVLGDVLQEMQFRQEQLRLDGDAHHYAATQERSPGGGGAGVGWARDLEALGHSYQSAYLQQLK
jgi:hypothetical protein